MHAWHAASQNTTCSRQQCWPDESCGSPGVQMQLRQHRPVYKAGMLLLLCRQMHCTFQLTEKPSCPT